jgi:hypothetical protein
VKGSYQVIVHEDAELQYSSVLNVFGEPYMLSKPKQPIGFDLTRKRNDVTKANGQAYVPLQES